MGKQNYTPAQSTAIFAEGKNMLVSASAGSGKTFVMIERVIRLILEGKASVDEILAVTYTVAAADEMKRKLIDAVIKEINSGRDVERFRKTLADVPSASISTFHGFCSSLLRNYFYALSLDPNFSVCDETQAETLRAKALNGLFADLYESADEDFLYLVRVFRSNRSDDRLKETVKSLYTFACSERSIEEFLDNAGAGVTEKAFYRAENELFNSYIAKLKEIKRIIANVLEDAQTIEVVKYVEHLTYLTVQIDTCLAAQNYRELYSRAKLELEKTPPVQSKDESIVAVRNRLSNAKKLLSEFLKSVLNSSPNGDEEKDLSDYLQTKRATSALCGLTKAFAERYAEEKRDESLADFSDLEHMAYKLLTKNEEILAAVKSKYKYIFADEYQDVNAVQEAILNLISQDNTFMVGDVKQSIYAFRGCNPDIFAAKYENFENGDGIPVSLDVNFRSSDGVLNAVNRIFVPLMTKSFGGVDYAANPMTGHGYPENCGGTYLHAIEGEDENPPLREGVYDLLNAVENPPVNEAFREGLLVGKLINEELHKTFYDVKKGEEREVTYKDIAVLTRNSSGFTTEIVRQLTRLSIPVSSSAKNPISEYPEIKLLTDVLKLIDRFADDAPLIAALKSPLGGLCEEEIAIIHSEAPPRTPKNGVYDGTKSTFFDNYLYYLSEGKNSAVREKLVRFDEYIAKLRLLAEFKSASEILTTVLSESALDLEILSMPLGEMRLKRVERFIAEAEIGGKATTVGKFLERLDAGLADISVGSSDGDNSVTVMSMHASKGLEFPIVILAGLSKKFNIDDTKREVLTDRNYGLALKLYDETEKTVKSTLVRSAFKERASLNLIKEEMRVFYVAVTRAKVRLHLVCAKGAEENDRYSSPLFASKFSAFVKTSYFDEYDETEETANRDALQKRKVYVSEGKNSLTEKISEYLSFVYPYDEDTRLPVKRAVTKLAEDLSSPTIVDADSETTYYFDEKSQRRGIAYHAYLQNCDLSNRDALQELDRLTASQKLTTEQRELIDADRLTAIINSPIFSELSGYELYREQPFVVSLPANEISQFSSKSELLVQGVIDLLAVKGDEAVIVDYKFSKKNCNSLKERYAPQLEIYKKAVEKTLGLKVKKCVLFNLSSTELIEV